MTAVKGGRLRRSIDRWVQGVDHEAVQLKRDSVEAGCCAINDAKDRTRVQIRGSIRTITLRPRGGVPALEAEVYDGSGVITVIWLGRRRISGIEPGREIEVTGRIGRQDTHRVMFNPRYELR